MIGGPPMGIVRGAQLIILYAVQGYGWYPAILILGFLISFLIHEFAHKFTAQHYGLWSEFRMMAQGYYLSLIAILFSVPIFGTGAVFSAGSPTPEQDGKINLAGPASNAAIAIFCTIGAVVSAALGGGLSPVADFAFSYLIQLNAFLGLFNMIPFQPLDGATVINWDKRIWLAMVIVLLALLIVGYVGISLLAA